MSRRVYVLDTTIISELRENHPSPVWSRLAQHGADVLCLCEPVIYEVERGFLHRQAPHKLAYFREQVMPLFEQVSLQFTDWQVASILWAETRRKGIQLSDIDLLITATAYRLEGVLVTSDDDFAVFPIPQENWRLP